MNKIAVIYKSHYGTAKQYAEWIAEATNAELFEASTIKPPQLMEFDTIIYGGGLYAGGILGAKLVAKNPCKSLVVFTVGLADPAVTDFSDIMAKQFPPEILAKLRVFHLRGAVDYSKLSFIHKALMSIVKKRAEKTPIEKRSDEDKTLLETYGGKPDFMNRETILPLVEYIRTQG